jgi:hypothetical protein
MMSLQPAGMAKGMLHQPGLAARSMSAYGNGSLIIPIFA